MSSSSIRLNQSCIASSSISSHTLTSEHIWLNLAFSSGATSEWRNSSGRFWSLKNSREQWHVRIPSFSLLVLSYDYNHIFPRGACSGLLYAYLWKVFHKAFRITLFVFCVRRASLSATTLVYHAPVYCSSDSKQERLRDRWREIVVSSRKPNVAIYT